jgi:hypothetical protein
MANEIKKIETENVKMKEKLVDMQCRTMKYNLIFTGLDEQADENCENKLRHFIYQDRIQFSSPFLYLWWELFINPEMGSSQISSCLFNFV